MVIATSIRVKNFAVREGRYARQDGEFQLELS
jgi:hypothetical protein